MLFAVIMAGGSGTRFWPESRHELPKQLLKVVGQRTLVQSTVDRLAGLIPPERILVVTGQRLVERMREQLPQLPADSILGEPCRRDTAPCIGLAATILSRIDPDATMLVMPADHVIGPDSAFQQAVRFAADLVERDPTAIVTFGIRPTYPAESFGYIERGDAFEVSGSVGASGDERRPRVFRVKQFREKPPSEIARKYLEAGSFYWNAGIFVWKARTVLDALRRYEPQMCEHLTAIAQAIGRSDYQAVLNREFDAIRPKSIDYAVMEKASNVQDVIMVEAPFQWDDVGSWQAIARLQAVDADGNTIQGKHLGVDTTGSIVRTTDDHLVVTLGVSDCIVVHTADATLVASKNAEESIRQVVKLLEERGWRQYL